MKGRSGWKGESRNHGLCAKGITVRKPKMKASGVVDRTEDIKQKYPEIVKSMDKLEFHREQRENETAIMLELMKELFETVGLEESHDLKTNYGSRFRDMMLATNFDFSNNIDKYPHDLMAEFMSIYNRKHPFKVGENVWNNQVQTWVIITEVSGNRDYVGYYFDEHGKKSDDKLFGYMGFDRFQ